MTWLKLGEKQQSIEEKKKKTVTRQLYNGTITVKCFILRG
jgi:hypothetical protein